MQTLYQAVLQVKNSFEKWGQCQAAKIKCGMNSDHSSVKAKKEKNESENREANQQVKLFFWGIVHSFKDLILRQAANAGGNIINNE